MKKLSKSQCGKLGAEATWKNRYEMLQELSKLISKDDLNWIQSKWKTKQIELLIRYYKNGRTN